MHAQLISQCYGITVPTAGKIVSGSADSGSVS